ncbi:hypothetical protein JCM3775_001656 [Rhodotorula graminis]
MTRSHCRNREAPSSLPPPAYSLQRYSSTTRNLRPAALIMTFFATIWGLVVGAAYLRNRNDVETPSSLKTVWLALAIVYFVCVAIEAFGFFASYKGSLGLVRLYFYGSLVVAALVTGAELARTVCHFTMKSDILEACAASYSSDIADGSLTTSTVESYCRDNWRNSSYIDIALLIFSLFIAFIFASLSASYLHQLKNPQSLRTHVPQLNASSQYAYPLAPYPGQQPPYPASANPYGAPPPPGYGGGYDATRLPSYDNPYGVSASDDKLPVQPAGVVQHPAPASNPFADSVEHGTAGEAEPVRREGETGDEFERRQHEWNVRRYGESTETVTLEPRK